MNSVKALEMTIGAQFAASSIKLSKIFVGTIFAKNARVNKAFYSKKVAELV